MYILCIWESKSTPRVEALIGADLTESNRLTPEKLRTFSYEVNNLENYWVFGLFQSSRILENRKHDVSETGSVSVLR
jgi:hypothetical protein